MRLPLCLGLNILSWPILWLSVAKEIFIFGDKMDCLGPRKFQSRFPYCRISELLTIRTIGRKLLNDSLQSTASVFVGEG
jgi:hypothetical protein